MPRRLRPPPLLPSFFSFAPSFPPSTVSFHFTIPPFLSTSPPLPSPPRLSTLLPTSFPPLLLLLAACVRSHAKRIATLKLNRGNATWTTAAVSCTRIRSLSFSLSLFLFVSPRGHMPRMCRHFLRIRGVRYFCPRTRRILVAHPWTVRFVDVWGWWSRSCRRVVGNRGELRFFCRRRRLCRLLRRSCLAGKQVVERCLNGGTRVDGCSYAGWGLMERGCFGCCGFFCFFFWMMRRIIYFYYFFL